MAQQADKGVYQKVVPYKGGKRVSPGSSKGVQKVFQGCFMGVLRLLLYHVKSIWIQF